MPTTRRSFLQTAAAAAGGLAVARRHATAAPATATESMPAPVKITSASDIVTLGKTGIKSTVLGIGTGYKGGRDHVNLGQTEFVKLMRHAYDRGLRYIDTADNYRTHLFVRFALKELPRDEIFIQSKTPAKNAEVAKADIERFRKELNTDPDSLLMHCMTKKNWPTDLRPVLDVLLEAKRKGRVRAVGVSCHTLDALKDAVDCEEIDVHLVRINPFQKHMEGTPEVVMEQIRKMRAKNRGIIGMKIFGEGELNTRQQRLESIKYALGSGCVNCFTIGFLKPAEIDETIELIKEATA